MKARTSIVDPTGNYEENIQRWGKSLGKNKLRRKLFDVIYGRGSKPRSKKQLMAAAGIKNADDQQAQNEIEYLYRKHLIARTENDSLVNDRSRYLYFKDEHVRACKDLVIKAADDKKYANSIPTKRSPVLNGKATTRKIITRTILKRRKHLDVLYLMATPIRRHSLRVDAEVSKVSEEIRRSQYRDNITLHQSPAANLDSIIHGLNDHRPRIVHFSGSECV
jgi:hypothetical protein